MSTLNVDIIKNAAGTGAPTFTYGLVSGAPSEVFVYGGNLKPSVQ